MELRSKVKAKVRTDLEREAALQLIQMMNRKKQGEQKEELGTCATDDSLSDSSHDLESDCVPSSSHSSLLFVEELDVLTQRATSPGPSGDPKGTKKTGDAKGKRPKRALRTAQDSDEELDVLSQRATSPGPSGDPKGTKKTGDAKGKRPKRALRTAQDSDEADISSSGHSDDPKKTKMKGCKDKAHGPVLKELMQTTNFRVTVVEESDVVEICGALKNIVAVGAGFCDGLGFGDNTKAAVIRLGLMEMIAFAKVFCTDCPVSPATFLESCGIADLITTCYGGRNRKIGEAFAKTGKTIEQLENELLNGQKLQGPATASEVHQVLKQKKMVEKFPLFTAVHQICFNSHPVTDFMKCLQDHPEHM